MKKDSWAFSFFCYLFLLGSLFLFFVSCSSIDHGPLIEQEMRFRIGHTGLTHTACREFFDGSCMTQDLVEYDFQDPKTLERLRAIRLICKVGERRFHICDDKIGLCSNSEETKEFLGVVYSTKIVTEILYMPEDLQVLLDAKTYCAAQGSISERGMF